MNSTSTTIHPTALVHPGARLGTNVEVGASAIVEADVSAGPIRVAGQVTGNFTSNDRVDLANGARVVGNVKAARITIADGAQFKGNVDMHV